MGSSPFTVDYGAIVGVAAALRTRAEEVNVAAASVSTAASHATNGAGQYESLIGDSVADAADRWKQALTGLSLACQVLASEAGEFVLDVQQTDAGLEIVL